MPRTYTKYCCRPQMPICAKLQHVWHTNNILVAIAMQPGQQLCDIQHHMSCASTQRMSHVMLLASIKKCVKQRRGKVVERASFSLFLVKARAEAKPHRGPKKDRRSLKGLRGYHYWKAHWAECRATWRATSPAPGHKGSENMLSSARAQC